jgi:RNA recognition motif-containing protein
MDIELEENEHDNVNNNEGDNEEMEDSELSTNKDVLHLNKNTENKTIIIKNISDSTTEEDITGILFQLDPEIKFSNVRVVRDNKGKTRNMCFVDFEDSNEAKKAVGLLNNISIHGNTIISAISKPPSLG